MLKRVTEAISRYSMFGRGQTAGVAVSGGADSVCLLHIMKDLATAWALRLKVLHFDHQLRGEESRQDAEFVRDVAGSLGLPFHMGTADVRRISAERGENLEQAARLARRQFLLGFLASGQVDRIALGHTRSDQAETVLFRFLRGSGTAGIAGMRPVTPEGFVRPLIAVERADVERYLRERGIPWREDSSNRDETFARNRIRHGLLPALNRDWNPSLAENLARMAALAQEDEDFWTGEMERLATVHFTRSRQAILLPAGLLTGLAPAVGRRLIRRAILEVKGDLRRIEFEHVAQIADLAKSGEGHGRLQVPGVDVYRSFDWIRFARPPEPGSQARNYRLPLQVPGRFPIPGLDSTLCLELIEISNPSPNYGYNTGEHQLDWSRITGPLELRNWRPGDRYRPAGHSVEERIKLLFQRARVPLWERGSWPLITSLDEILWARGFGPAAEFAPVPGTRLILQVGVI